LSVVTFIVLAGCQGEPAAPPKQPPPAAIESPTSVALRVLVVNDQPLAEAIGRLRGEWREGSGAELAASSLLWKDIATADKIDADVIVFPTRYMGELCVRGQLRPVRKSVLDDKALDLADVFPLARRQLISWGGQVMALPLGINLPSDAALLQQQPGVRLLQQVARRIVSRERLGDLFDPDTMKPTIEGPAFVDAIKRLSETKPDNNAERQTKVSSVPVLGFEDRLIGVTSSSRNAAIAFRLLAWLASPDVSSQLARVGDAVLPVRKSQESSAKWYDPKLGASDRAELGKTLEAALSGNECLIVPRILGVDDYMAALDQAVKNVVSDHADPAAELNKAAERWEQITEAHGRAAQRQAYQKHLGISEQ
jgi:hypothetical protein